MANIVGTKWGNSKLGTPGGTVTWSIAGAGIDITRFGTTTKKSVSGNSFLDHDYTAIIASAFAEWSKYGDIEFKQVADGGGAAGVGNNADIRIFFGEIPGGTAGYAFYPSAWGSAIAGDIMLDTLAIFNTDPVWFFNLVLHEIGHSLGLGHVSGNAIMNANVKKIGLQPDDIGGIQEIYGVQDGASEVPQDDTNTGSDDHDHDDHDHDGHSHDPDDQDNNNSNNNNNNNNNNTTNEDKGTVYSGISTADKFVGTENNDTIYGNGGWDTLIGNSGDDLILGNKGRDFLVGNRGEDTLRGGNDADVLVGGKNDDLLYGDNANDTIYGSNGNDTLVGGRGADVLEGGAGNDVFIFDDGEGNDRIRGFEANNGSEKIDFSNLSTLNNLSQVMNAAVQSGANVNIKVNAYDAITLENVWLNQLDNSDFIF